MKKSILFLSHYFPPEVNAPANRTFEHCIQWTTETDVTVITNFPNHPDGKIFPGYKNKLIQKENINGINVIRLLTFIAPNEGFLFRIINYLFFLFVSVLYSVISGIKCDIVIATTPQFFCGLAGKYISKLKRKPFILDLRDLWPESIIAVGAIKNRSVIKILEKMEIGLYNSADKIISVTSSFKNILIGRGIASEKIEIIYNGILPEGFRADSSVSNVELSHFLDDDFKVGYIGTIGMAHSIITLINTAEKLKSYNIKFVIVGSGAERTKLEDEIKLRSLRNVRIFPIQPRNEIPSIIKSLDVFCVHLKKDALFSNVIPSKIFEGMIMGKPVLIGVNGESRKIIEEANCGIYFEPENANQLAEKILYYKNNPDMISEQGTNGLNFVLEKYDRKILAKKYLGIIYSLIN